MNPSEQPKSAHFPSFGRSKFLINEKNYPVFFCAASQEVFYFCMIFDVIS